MKLTDQQLEEIGATLHKVCEGLSESSGGIPFLVTWGCQNGEETVEGFSKTPNLEWEAACKILVGSTQFVSQTFN